MKKYDGVMQRVRIIEEKHGIKYAKTDGKLYSALNVLFIISAIWSLLMNLFFLLGILFRYSGTEDFGGFKNALISVSICSVLVIVGYVLNRVKLYEASGIISVVACVLTAVTFAPLLEDTLGLLGYSYSFYLRHVAPNAAMIIFIVWMSILAIRARYYTNRQYKKVTENLFLQYRTQDITDEQWDEFLRDYTPFEKMAVVEDEG